MLKNYFLVAMRHLTRNRFHSAINIIGLATGMTVTILIALWVWDELSFDHYHKNHSRLAEIISVDNTNAGVDAGTNASVPVAAALRSKYPDEIRATAATAPGSF